MKAKNKTKIYKLLDLLIEILIYSLIILMFSLIFKNTIYIDNSYYGIWSIITSMIIFLFNRTIKPLLVWLTLPITALSLGLFYPFINVLILKLTDFILCGHFNISGYIMPFVIAILISLVNLILNGIVHKILGGK